MKLASAADTRLHTHIRRYGNELMFASAISVNRTSWHFPGRTSADNNTAPISPGPLVLWLLSQLFRCVHRISGAILRFLPATMPFRTASVSSSSHTRSISRAFQAERGNNFRLNLEMLLKLLAYELFCSKCKLTIFETTKKNILLITKH